MRDDEIIGLLHDVIDGKAPTLPQKISESKDSCFSKFTAAPTSLLVSTHSPVSLHLYDSQDRHTGPIQNEDIEFNIPESDYDQISGNSFASVPFGGSYRIVIDALSGGKFDLELQIRSEEKILATITYLDVPLQGENTSAELRFIDLDENLNLQLDTNGDGTVDAAYKPTAILDAEEGTDVVPPEIIMPSIPEEVILNTSLEGNFSATDDLSGVAFVNGFLDHEKIEQNAVVNTSKIGKHTFRVETSDRAGNPRANQLNFNVVYDFGGFLPPLRDGETYKRGRVIPIKFQLADYNGNFIGSASPKLYVAKVENGTIKNEKLIASGIDFGARNGFRYDSKEGQYIFNLSTTEMEVGEWRLRIELEDGKDYFVKLSIK